jgi:pimeloyl-ACP methyl ester carboxylesterase
MSRFLFNARIAAALALAVLLVGVAARADVIILKDGFTIQAMKTVQEKEVVLDPTVGPLISPKANGMTAADDGPRWVIFPTSTRQLAEISENNRFRDFAAYTRDRTRGDLKLPSNVVNPITTKKWDYKEWKMEVKYDDANDKHAKYTVKLQITVITPYYVRIGSENYGNVARYYLTSELGPELVRKFLVNHPDLVEKPDKPDPVRREKLIRFWIQADWLDEADKDLAELIAVLPAEKERHARLKSEVNALRAEKLVAEIERAKEAGRHQWAIRELEKFPTAFPKQDVPKPAADKVTLLRGEYARRTDQFSRARRYLTELAAKINPASNKWLIDAAKVVQAEVNMDTLGRIDMFLTLAERAEKDAKDGRRPTHSPEDLLSAAITGWHLGKVAAEPKVDLAYRVWMTRQMALEYLRTPAPNGRDRVLKGWLGGPNALKYDELEKLISLLPPPEAPAELPSGTTAMSLPPSVQAPGGINFVLRLPDEYQPGRSYPLFLLLPDPFGDQNPPGTPMQNFLDRFGELPNRLGYIVASVEWWPPGKFSYEYTKDEQGMVMTLLSYLRRAYQVDSDRIFLCGNGEGGALALDLGGSHPDTFAGVVPFNPTVVGKLYITCEYWVNFYQLPVYLVMGDKFGGSVATIRMMSERWMPKGFPTLIVSYKGRGKEWFPGELPYMFDWMGRKRRADPGRVLGPPTLREGMKPGFSSVRFADNRYHWLSMDIRPERVIGPIVNAQPGAPIPTPVKIAGNIVEGNTIKASAIGARDVTVWFGKGMVDYNKPVKVQVSDSKPVTKTITPEIPVLMEDLYERADRQRPYFAKLDFKVP